MSWWISTTSLSKFASRKKDDGDAATVSALGSMGLHWVKWSGWKFGGFGTLPSPVSVGGLSYGLVLPRTKASREPGRTTETRLAIMRLTIMEGIVA
jgi:hypothetical protein